jgi:enoyl-CoA hydratase/carnithine racemase
MIEEAEQHLSLEADDSIGCMVVVTGNEKSFAAGADIKAMQPKKFIDMLNRDFLDVGDHNASPVVLRSIHRQRLRPGFTEELAPFTKNAGISRQKPDSRSFSRLRRSHRLPAG